MRFSPCTDHSRTSDLDPLSVLSDFDLHVVGHHVTADTDLGRLTTEEYPPVDPELELRVLRHAPECVLLVLELGSLFP
jgi:hypothetical protein